MVRDGLPKKIAVLLDFVQMRGGRALPKFFVHFSPSVYDSMSDLGEIRVYQRADFQSGSRVLKKVF